MNSEQHAPLRILLVEDNEHDRIAFRRAFQKSALPFEMTDFGRAEEALMKLRTAAAAFDIVVTDYKLPGMSGLAFCEELLKHQIPLPLVILTGGGSEHLAVEALKTGVNDYIIKDPNRGYLDLLPVVLPETVRKHHDRQARLQAEAKIRELNQELEQKLILSEKMAALGSLVAEVTHEVNTPLSSCMLVASSLEEKTRTLVNLFQEAQMKRSDLATYLQLGGETAHILLMNLQRVADLIRSFKIVAVDRCREEPRRFNVKEYLDEILLTFRPKLKKTRHTVTLNCPPDIDLTGDPGAFSQIISNLIMNSLIHGFEQNEQGEIVIAVRRENKQLILQYSDNGKGIEHDLLPKIFDPFFTTKRDKGSSGIGMSIVQKLVSQTLHGTITCESTPQVGTTFTIHIPLNEGDHYAARQDYDC